MREVERKETGFDRLALTESQWINTMNGCFDPQAHRNGYGSPMPYPSAEELAYRSQLPLAHVTLLHAEATSSIIPLPIYFRQLNGKVRQLMKEKGIRLNKDDKPLSTKLTKAFFNAIRQGKTDLIACSYFTPAQLTCIAHMEEELL